MNQPREPIDPDMVERLRERLADALEARAISEKRARGFEAQVHQLRNKLQALARLKPEPVDPSANGAPRRRHHVW